MTTMTTQAPQRRKTRSSGPLVVHVTIPWSGPTRIAPASFRVRGLHHEALERPCVLRAVCSLERALGMDPRSVGQTRTLTMRVRVARALVESVVGCHLDRTDPTAVAAARDRLCEYVGRIEFCRVKGSALIGTSRESEVRYGPWRAV